MPVLCMGVFYMLSCGFGVEALWVDIALYVLVMAAGFWIAYWQSATGAWCVVRRGAGDCGRTLRGGADFVYALAPPELPVFVG